MPSQCTHSPRAATTSAPPAHRQCTGKRRRCPASAPRVHSEWACGAAQWMMNARARHGGLGVDLCRGLSLGNSQQMFGWQALPAVGILSIRRPSDARLTCYRTSDMWCRREGSNPGPAAYKAAALPTELQRLSHVHSAGTTRDTAQEPRGVYPRAIPRRVHRAGTRGVPGGPNPRCLVGGL